MDGAIMADISAIDKTMSRIAKARASLVVACQHEVELVLLIDALDRAASNLTTGQKAIS